jgi:hypothetical protein
MQTREMQNKWYPKKNKKQGKDMQANKKSQYASKIYSPPVQQMYKRDHSETI